MRHPKDIGSQVPDSVRSVCDTLRRHGHDAWVVGGCVRDLLLDRPINDWDIASSATPQETKKCFSRVIPTGIQHGTVTVLVGDEGFEVTTLRGEGAYSDGRRPDEVFFVTDIEQDLARRDFTVNAIAYDPVSNALIDPFKGQVDLEAKLIRAVGVALERFTEDGLRILRGARFVATLECELEAQTEAAMSKALDTFAKVSPERVRDEWLKAMKAAAPSRAFEVMRRTGILGVTYPEMLDQVGCEQNSWHAYDVWGHTMSVLDAFEGTPIERMAALLHDIAKPATRARSEKTGEWSFIHHEHVGANMADQWLRDFRFGNQERERIVHLVRHHLICYASDWSDAAVRRFIKRIGVEAIDPLLRLGHADAAGKGKPVDDQHALLKEMRARIDAEIAAGSAISVKDLKVSGKDIIPRLSAGPGPAVGALLRHLLDEVIGDPTLNQRDLLLKKVDLLLPEFEAKFPRGGR